MDNALLVSLFSMVIALASAMIAYLAVKEQRRLTSNITSYTQMAATEQLIEKYPEILGLYGITETMLADAGVTKGELIYLSQSFSASEFYHRLAHDEEIVLTPYRRNLLDQPKVRATWALFLRGRFITDPDYVAAIDRYVAGSSPRNI